VVTWGPLTAGEQGRGGSNHRPKEEALEPHYCHKTIRRKQSSEWEKTEGREGKEKPETNEKKRG